MRRLGSEKLEFDLVHPVEYEDDRVAWVMIEGDETLLFRFEAPETVVTTFLGSLSGGRYAETITGSQMPVTVEGVFEHPRLRDDEPLRVTVTPVTDPNDYRRPGFEAARERTTQLRETFRRWSTEPLPPQPQSPG